jgi:hypothetical protein
MSRFFSIIVIFAILVVGGGYLWMQKSEQDAKVRVGEKLVDARRNFSDKARAAITEDDDADYIRSIKAALKAYDAELKAVYKEKPQWRDPEAFQKRVEAEFKEGKLNESQRKSMLEGYEIVKDAYDTLMAANWEPILTQKGEGDTRFDMYSVKRIRDDQGNAVLEAKVLFWGIEDNTRMTWGDIALRYWVKRMKEVKQGKKMVEEEVEEVLGKADGDATPRLILQDPKKYIDEFPAFVSVGYIWLPVMPRESHAMDIEYSYSAKKGGGKHDTQLKWEKFAVPERWKLKEGEAWEADVVEATEDEIAGTKPDAGVDEEGKEAEEE